MDRLPQRRREDVAISGIHGARNYLPSLDILPGAALKPIEKDESPQVIIHLLHSPTAYFIQAGDGMRWADELECLIDLHEVHFEYQALEFMNEVFSM